MNLWQAFKMAFRSIWGNKGRSILTMLGVIIGISAVMTIFSVAQGLNRKTMEQFEAMGTNTISVYAYSYNRIDLFNELYAYCLQLGDLVEGVTPQADLYAESITYGIKSKAEIENSQNAYIRTQLGSHQYSLCNNFQIAKGRDLSKIDIDQYKNVCVMGAQAAKYFFDLADPVGKTIYVNSIPFTVVGVYAVKDTFSPPEWSMDNIIVFPYSSARALGQDTRDMNNFLVKAKSAGAISEVTTKITGFLTGILGDPQNPNSAMKGEFSIYSDSIWQEQSSELMLMMSLVLGGIAAISLLVGGIGIMNIMLVTVTERTKEIGIRRAIGAKRTSIVTQFLIEAGVICGIGGVIGAGFGTLLTVVGSQLLIKEMFLPTPGITVLAVSVAVGIGIIFGLYPAVKASGLQPVAALRAE